MIRQRLGEPWDSPAERTPWARPGQAALLLLTSSAWLAWWGVCAVVGPVWIAARPNQSMLEDETWIVGDGR
ncbi:MAG: hypothetical protein IT305_24045 [Chloroflexi bacterium]|nr:hypothetical protein [Chloroflexota bacterium]